ncbi:MAG: chloride channel protein [Myxococcales bacterium]
MDPPHATRTRATPSARLPRILLRLVPNERQQLFALTVVIGGVCGLAAVAFHLLINLVTQWAIDPALAAPGRSWIGWTLLVPTAGGLASGALLQYVVPNARGSGIPQVKVAYAGRGGPLRIRDSIGKFFIGALQIGTGASLGREGPTVQICAGIASRIGRLAGVSPQNLKRLLPVGAAAGIAAAFNAPIAAVTFTIEEVVGDLDQTVLSGVVVAAALAATAQSRVRADRDRGEGPRGRRPLAATTASSRRGAGDDRRGAPAWERTAALSRSSRRRDRQPYVRGDPSRKWSMRSERRLLARARPSQPSHRSTTRFAICGHASKNRPAVVSPA